MSATLKGWVIRVENENDDFLEHVFGSAFLCVGNAWDGYRGV